MHGYAPLTTPPHHVSQLTFAPLCLPQVLRYLHRSYCLEPRFECWAELQSGSRRPPAQLRSQLGTWGTLAAAALLFCIACRRRGGRSAEKPPDHKV